MVHLGWLPFLPVKSPFFAGEITPLVKSLSFPARQSPGTNPRPVPATDERSGKWWENMGNPIGKHRKIRGKWGKPWERGKWWGDHSMYIIIYIFIYIIYIYICTYCHYINQYTISCYNHLKCMKVNGKSPWPSHGGLLRWANHRLPEGIIVPICDGKQLLDTTNSVRYCP